MAYAPIKQTFAGIFLEYFFLAPPLPLRETGVKWGCCRVEITVAAEVARSEEG